METICTEKYFPYHHWEYLHRSSGDRLRIVPERGGLITEWRSNDQEVLYFDLQRFLQVDKSIRGGIPILFPICGNLPKNLLCLQTGNFYMNQHGFARDHAWEISLNSSEESINLRLFDNDNTRSVFPYSFLLEIELKLKKNLIDFAIQITNTSDVKMPFAFGLHPYFNVTDLQEIKILGLEELCFDHLTMHQSTIPDQLLKLSEGVDFQSANPNIVSLINLINGRTIQLHQQPPFDLTVVWTDPPRRMICLEPWTSPRGSLSSGERKLELDPGSMQKLHCRIDVK